MERHGEEVDVSTTEARAGSTPHIVRWVLIISLVLIVGGMSAIWIFGAATTDDEVASGTAPEQPVLPAGAAAPNEPGDASDTAIPGVGAEGEEPEMVDPQ
ncbi:hypothetical protein [Croceicoccus sp. YJ47]|uniref:hypothetical protein n=1 Tax=Croceicoccus sp. YJ47 TaxID=2798724 RepID=UPI00192137E8|nr:hypothetical protein [Croceicoccus sp. YJ47]QQN74592.1 hypothetical protein JD971_02105 [Croceicoccus sp. YJ47]